jgi:hypothetical protein
MIKKIPFYKGPIFQWSIGTAIGVIAILVAVFTPEIRKLIFEHKYYSTPVSKVDSVKETNTKYFKPSAKRIPSQCYKQITFYLRDTISQKEIKDVEISCNGGRNFLHSYTESGGKTTICLDPGNEVKSKIRFENMNYYLKDITIKICEKNTDHTDTTIYLKPK